MRKRDIRAARKFKEQGRWESSFSSADIFECLAEETATPSWAAREWLPAVRIIKPYWERKLIWPSLSKEAQKDYYRKNWQRIRENQKRYYRRKREQCQATIRAWQRRNRDRINARRRELAAKNREKERARQKAWRDANREKHLAHRRKKKALKRSLLASARAAET